MDGEPEADRRRHRRLTDAFHRAARLPAAERRRWLEHALGADEALRREVEALLAAGGEGLDLLDRLDRHGQDRATEEP